MEQEDKGQEVGAFLERLQTNIDYSTEYNQYMRKFEQFYPPFMKMKSEGFSFQECFEATYGKIDPPRGEAQIDAYNDFNKFKKHINF